ncbi:hypothetical protein OPQ81_000481 [Rhizoctonia solani]|nr:hypothetical protein OPQ81_000481 [Rhizoctonia solani]
MFLSLGLDSKPTVRIRYFSVAFPTVRDLKLQASDGAFPPPHLHRQVLKPSEKIEQIHARLQIEVSECTPGLPPIHL